MSNTEKELFTKSYGPYDHTIFAIFESVQDGFCLKFDEGPDYNYEQLNSDATTVFKFPSGITFQLRVTREEDRSLRFHGSHLPASAGESLALADSAGGEQLAGPTPVCGSEFCSEVIPCPDPTKRVMICTGGIPRCVSST